MTLFSEVIQAPGATTAAVANQVDLGDITLPQSARMITRVWATVAIVGSYAAAQSISGYIKLESEDCNIAPFQFPTEICGGYVTVGGANIKEATKWLVGCQVPGGAVISVYHVQDDAVAACEVQVTLEFSDGGSPFPGGQLHMKTGEPSVACGTGDDAAASLSDIEVKASKIHMLTIYGLQATPTADCALAATFAVTSDDFAVPGPWKGSINPHCGGETNTVQSSVDLTKIEADRAFRVAGQKQTVSCVATTREACAGNGHYNWTLVYS